MQAFTETETRAAAAASSAECCFPSRRACGTRSRRRRSEGKADLVPLARTLPACVAQAQRREEEDQPEGELLLMECCYASLQVIRKHAEVSGTTMARSDRDCLACAVTPASHPACPITRP
jgi:hypothetical protein